MDEKSDLSCGTVLTALHHHPPASPLRRIILLALWQLVFLLQIFLLSGLAAIAALVVLPDLGEAAASVAADGADEVAVQAAVLAAIVAAAFMLPFYVYAFRLDVRI